MTYQEALKIAYKVEGYIKCTYMELFSTDNKKLFSVQNRGLRLPSDGTERIEMDFVLPVVYISEYQKSHYSGKVYAYLTDELRAYLRFFVEKIIDEPSAWYGERMQEILRIVNENDVVLVKEVAVNWIPADSKRVIIKDKNGNDIELGEAMEKAEEELKQAKIMLAGAGVAAVIL